jgi:branched-chain amino acid transport system substrate-binding protein
VPARPTCPYCGASLSAAARYCDRCGTPLQQETAHLSRRRPRPSGRVALWAFVLVLLCAFGVGTLGGFGFKAGGWSVLAAAPGTTRPVFNSGTFTPSLKPTQEDPAAVGNYLRSVVTINARGPQGDRWGSGFVVDQAGHVVTAAHVVEGYQGCLTVLDDNGAAHAGTLLGFDRALDVALLHVEGMEKWSNRLELGRRTSTVGDDVLVLGTPRGVSKSVPLSATVDRLSVSQTSQGRAYHDLIELSDAVVFDGTSGGPLVDKATGQVAGMVVLSGAPAALAWAVPASDLIPKVAEWSVREPGAQCTYEKAATTVPLTLMTVTPRTTAFSVEGEDLADGAELALRDMDDALRAAGYAVTLKREDDRGQAGVARDKAAEAVRDPQVIGVVGSLDSQVTQALAEALQTSGMPLVAPTSGASDLTERNWQHFSRIVANNRRQEQVLANAAKDLLRAGTLYVLEDGTAEAARQLQTFKAAAQIIGLKVAGTAQVSTATDMVALKEQLAAASAEAIYLAGVPGETALEVVRGLRREGVALPVLGSQALADARFRAFVGDGAQGIYFTRLTAEANDPFRRRFESVFGKPTRGYAAYGYDGARVILEALLRYGQSHAGKVPSRTELASLVRQTQGHLGHTSRITFDRAGDNETSWVYLYQWKQGVPEPVANLQ